jgi:uncharacterized membrane protein YfcA
VGRIREAIGTSADLIQIGLFVALIAGGAIGAFFLSLNDVEVSGWVLLAVAGPLALAIPLAYLLGRRIYRRLSPETAERAREQGHAEVPGPY